MESAFWVCYLMPGMGWHDIAGRPMSPREREWMRKRALQQRAEDGPVLR